ncbi:asparaginase [Halorussus amylolyticus]|uniref:asparaginase n=1 Tax=Halorussus amylolyticus TaxID=1126242 RepID=UPI0010525B12|nr:asparaginase [Halorussus amylolyticus]
MTPTVRILSTGGTIASTSDGDDDAKSPSKSGDDLVAAVPELADHADIEVEEIAQVSGFDMDFEKMAATARAAEAAAAEGVDGLVVTHGTDTMEETAYYLDLVTDLDVPITLTGAQRPFDQVGTDGPPNLLASVRTVTDDRFSDGVYLTFNDAVHAAREVTKSHTSKLETFASPETGPVGEFTPSGLRLLGDPGSRAVSMPGTEVDADVALVTSAAGVTERAVERALEDGADGIVVAGTGLGNVTGGIGRAMVEALDDGVPVVDTSRCYAGRVAGLYGGDGGGRTLEDAGVIQGGDLPAWKARVKLALAITHTDDLDGVRAYFEDDER